ILLNWVPIKPVVYLTLTKQRPMTSKNSALREPTFQLTQGAAFIFCLLDYYKSTEILSYLKISRKECSIISNSAPAQRKV
ncbi:MAG: hypothetical protein Q4P84_00585, partial [Elusimicrobiales bacterium]|nr:hypothetical protein [Elusimicrobiales bacterium]